MFAGHAGQQRAVGQRQAGLQQPFDVPLHDECLVDQVPRGE
jgi:hypothetical protein